jgi:hypothetical protein
MSIEFYLLGRCKVYFNVVYSTPIFLQVGILDLLLAWQVQGLF